MNDVPLVKDNKINDINTSIIAIKKQLKQINEAVGLIDISDAPDLSPYVKKSDIVDVVALNNMHSVSSDGVARALSYSTEEIATGGKWIDGKDIYRKIFNTGVLPNATTKAVDIGVQNIGSIIKMEGFAYSEATIIPIPYASNSNGEPIKVYINRSNNTINISADINYGLFVSSYIVLEYTKTTD